MTVTRIPTTIARWSWTVRLPDGSFAGGWAATRWGARRAARRALAAAAREEAR